MTYLSTLNWKDETYYNQHPHQAKLRDACLSRVNWDALCRYASSKNSGRQCTLLEQNTLGGGHLIRLLRFPSPETSESNQTLWIARIQLEQSTPETESLLCAEINTMELVRIKAGIPVPRIYGYELSDGNSVRAAFTLMDFIPGSSAMDADGGFKIHAGRVPDERKKVFFEEVARVQVNLSSIRLPKIGSVIRRPDNSFDVGPLPHLGGPFSTANEFFEAWARHAKFPSSEESIREIMRHSPSSIREKVLYSIQNFPKRLQELASGGRISTRNNTGPFPLYHPDLYHSNIIVDESYKVLGVIDWEGACTVPWEIIQPPLFLTTVPPAMDDTGKYGEDGRPKDLNTIRQYADVADYVRCVQEAEEGMGTDQTLSGIMLNPAVQGLAFALKVYLDPGKMGLYCNVLEPFGHLNWGINVKQRVEVD